MSYYPSNHSFYRSHKALNDAILALESAGMSYEFIDPETRAEAQQNTERAREAYSRGTQHHIDAYNKKILLNTKKRDEKIIVNILQQTAEQNGGIIYIGGFMHTHLVHELHKASPDYRFAIFADSSEEYVEDNIVNTDHTTWQKCYHAGFRNQYYKANVVFFNMEYDRNLSFEMIEAACQLTQSRTLNEQEHPQPVVNFEQIMPNSEYTIDEHHVITASQTFNNPIEAVASFVNKGVGLRFFMQQNPNGTTQVDVPGINLRENSQMFR